MPHQRFVELDTAKVKYSQNHNWFVVTCFRLFFVCCRLYCCYIVCYNILI